MFVGLANNNGEYLSFINVSPEWISENWDNIYWAAWETPYGKLMTIKKGLRPIQTTIFSA